MRTFSRFMDGFLSSTLPSSGALTLTSETHDALREDARLAFKRVSCSETVVRSAAAPLCFFCTNTNQWGTFDCDSSPVFDASKANLEEAVGDFLRRLHCFGAGFVLNKSFDKDTHVIFDLTDQALRINERDSVADTDI